VRENSAIQIVTAVCPIPLDCILRRVHFPSAFNSIPLSFDYIFDLYIFDFRFHICIWFSARGFLSLRRLLS